MSKKKISSLEYKLAEILNIKETLETCEPRTLAEENQAANERVSHQLSTLKTRLLAS